MNQLILKRLSVRSVDQDAHARLRTLSTQLRIPMALLIEEAVQLLWADYIASGYDLCETDIIV